MRGSLLCDNNNLKIAEFIFQLFQSRTGPGADRTRSAAGWSRSPELATLSEAGNRSQKTGLVIVGPLSRKGPFSTKGRYLAADSLQMARRLIIGATVCCSWRVDLAALVFRRGVSYSPAVPCG